MNQKIQIRAEFSISQENLREFVVYIKQLSKIIKEKEPNTTEYLFYLDEKNTICHVHESYENSDAAIAHNNNFASKTILQKIFQISTMNKIDVYGAPSEELKELLTAFNARFFTVIAGYRF